MAIAITILKHAFMLHGLRLNMKPNKTAGMINMRYKDAQAVTHHYLVSQQGRLFFEADYFPDPCDLVAQDYAMALRVAARTAIPIEEWSCMEPHGPETSGTNNHGVSRADSLHLVFDYLHMGSYMDSKGSMRREIAHRTSQGLSAQRPLNTKIIANKRIQVTTRKYLHAAYCLSRTTYNCQTWPELGKADFKKKIHQS